MKDMEQKISNAFQHAAPNVLESVLSDCREQKGAVIVMTQKKHSWAIRIGAIAAAFILIAGLGCGFGIYQANHTVESTISLDVNPSVELTVNRKERVLDATAHNEDGYKILAGMDLEGSHMEVAVNAILGSMLRNGYLTDMSNAILVSVDGKDASASAQLQAELTEQIGQLLAGSNFTGAVLSQTVSKKTELETLADENNISVGKAQLIWQIVTANPQHTFQELASLSINELTLLSESSKVTLEAVTTTGSASQKSYVGQDAALEAALKDAGTTKDKISGLEIDMDYEDGKMVYEVEFELNGADFDYDIDAVTGNILYSEKETAPGSNTETPTTGADTSAASSSGTASTGSSAYITANEAKSKAFAHAGVKAADVRDVDCDLDKDGGNVHYEVDFSCGGWEYEYEIDAVTGTVLSSHKEKDD